MDTFDKKLKSIIKEELCSLPRGKGETQILDAYHNILNCLFEQTKNINKSYLNEIKNYYLSIEKDSKEHFDIRIKEVIEELKEVKCKLDK